MYLLHRIAMKVNIKLLEQPLAQNVFHFVYLCTHADFSHLLKTRNAVLAHLPLRKWGWLGWGQVLSALLVWL